MDSKRAILFQPFQFFATRFGRNSAKDRLHCSFSHCAPSGAPQSEASLINKDEDCEDLAPVPNLGPDFESKR